MSTPEPTTDIVEDFVPADGWATNEAKPYAAWNKQAESQELAEAVAIFLAVGGKIQQIPIGAITLVEAPNGKAGPMDYRGKCNTALMAKFEARDRIHCAKCRQEFERNPDVTVHKMRYVLGLSITATVRVLDAYFSDDPVGQRILAQYRGRALQVRGYSKSREVLPA